MKFGKKLGFLALLMSIVLILGACVKLDLEILLGILQKM